MWGSWSGEEEKGHEWQPIMAVLESSESTECKTEDAEPDPPVGIILNPPVAFNPRSRRTYGQVRVSQDEKRERNRVTFRRFYRRKQEILRGLREEEAALVNQYERLKSSHLGTNGEFSTHGTGDALLMDLINRKDSAAAEHTALQHLAQQQLQTRRLMSRLLDALDDEDAREENFVVHASAHDYNALLLDAINCVQSIKFDSPSAQSDDAFGWNCTTQQVGQNLEYRFVKDYFTTQQSFDMAEQTLLFCSQDRSDSPTSSAAPSPLIQIRRRRLANGDNGQALLVYRMIKHTSRGEDAKPQTVVAKSSFFVSRVQIDSHPPETNTAIAITSHSVPNQELFDPVGRVAVEDLHASQSDDEDLDFLVGATPRQIHEEWIDELNWWLFEPLPSGIRVEFTGRFPLSLGLSRHAWYLELLALVMRWENAILGAAPILSSGQ